MKVAVFGLGYVGTVTAAGLAHVGHAVVGVDVDADKVAAINAGREPGGRARDRRAPRQPASTSGRLRATTSAREAVAACRRVPRSASAPRPAATAAPTSPTSNACLDEIRAAMAQVAPPASGFHAVVVRSTVPPGTVDDVVAPGFRRAAVPAGTSARRCAPSSCARASASRTSSPRRSSSWARPTRGPAPPIAELFSFLDVEARHVAVATAESLKYACNAFHATKVSFANELARVLSGCGVDSREVMEIFCQDTKLNISPTYLRPGFAYGGSCLPKDLRVLLHLARTNGVDAPLLAGTALTNELVVRDVVERVIDTGDAARRPARAELQGRHRRPAREPERRPGRAPPRQGLRGAHLRPDHQPRPAGRRQPPPRRGTAAPPEPAARPHSRRRRWRTPRSSWSPPPPERVDRRSSRPAAPSTSSTCPAGSATRSSRCPGYSGVGW